LAYSLHEIDTHYVAGVFQPFLAALAAIRAFDKAAGVMPWEFSPLMGRMGGPGTLRDALFAMATEKERKSWERFARRYEQIDLTVNPSPAAQRALEYLEKCRREV